MNIVEEQKIPAIAFDFETEKLAMRGGSLHKTY
jgi:hypothetical protein